MKNLINNLGRKIKISLVRISKDPKPANFPFISGDNFRKIADFVFDEISNFNPEDVKENQIVFVRTDYLEKFFKELHPKINNRYKLITHNSDKNITEVDLKFIDDKIIYWFAQNVLVNHPKIIPIPIGIENEAYKNYGQSKVFKKALIKIPENKKDKIFFNFTTKSNLKVRSAALKELEQNKDAETVNGWMVPLDYLNKIKQYKFIASPEGNGADCHRTWEAFYMKTIPIVLRNTLTESFEKEDLPILLLNNWSEVRDLSASKLSTLYVDIMSKANLKTLDFDYWKNKII